MDKKSVIKKIIFANILLCSFYFIYNYGVLHIIVYKSGNLPGFEMYFRSRLPYILIAFTLGIAFINISIGELFNKTKNIFYALGSLSFTLSYFILTNGYMEDRIIGIFGVIISCILFTIIWQKKLTLKKMAFGNVFIVGIYFIYRFIRLIYVNNSFIYYPYEYSMELFIGSVLV
jgi:hypothetical protein